MGYLSILNLYKDQTILMFKECYALEKIHGTSTHIKWNYADKRITFASGGENYEKFISFFDKKLLLSKFIEHFPDCNVVIYGEAYGGKLLHMSATYGIESRFIAFDININDMWLSVPKADNVAQKMGLEFVDYAKVSTDLAALDAERDKDSTQAIRNGMGAGKRREGVVLRPLIEVTLNNGDRIITKHKRDEFMETKTPRAVSPEKLKVLSDANEISDEWVTEMRLSHILDKLPKNLSIANMQLVIRAMIVDVLKESKSEIIESKEVIKSISQKTAILFKNRIKK